MCEPCLHGGQGEQYQVQGYSLSSSVVTTKILNLGLSIISKFLNSKAKLLRRIMCM